MSTRSTVYFDRDCGFCSWSVDWVRRLDWLRALRFVSLQSEEARVLGIEEHKTVAQMVFRRTDTRCGGWRAAKQILFRLPVFYLVLVGLLVLEPIFALLVAVGLTPLGNPVGNAAYRWVARNRNRFPGSTCTVKSS